MVGGRSDGWTVKMVRRMDARSEGHGGHTNVRDVRAVIAVDAVGHVGRTSSRADRRADGPWCVLEEGRAASVFKL